MALLRAHFSTTYSDAGRRPATALTVVALLALVAGLLLVPFAPAAAAPAPAGRTPDRCPDAFEHGGETYTGVKYEQKDRDARSVRDVTTGKNIDVKVDIDGPDVSFQHGDESTSLPVYYCLKASTRVTGILGPADHGTTEGRIENDNHQAHDISHLYVYAAVTGPVEVPGFVCATDTVYSIDEDTHEISRLKPSTGGATGNGDFDRDGNDQVNALALPAGGGRYAYAYDRDEDEVLRLDATTGEVDSYDGSAGYRSRSVIAGAINPADGLYYYAAGGSTWQLYAFDTGTHTAIGQVGTISGLFDNGDFAFDAVGNLFVVSNADHDAAGTLARVNGPLPTGEGTEALSATVLTDSLPEDSGQYAAMAFDGNGELVVGTGSGTVLRVNPTSGDLIDSKDVSLDLSDMTSCSAPSTAAVRVDLPQGRHATSDQFQVAVTGNEVTSGNTGTTTGTDTGLQDQPAEVGGPVVVLPSTSYTVTQTAVGTTDLDDYTTTWQCENDSTGASIASGTGSSGSVTVPNASGSSVVCTFTNIPRPAAVPSIRLDKEAGAVTDLDRNGPDAGDTIAYRFTVTNTGAVTLTDVEVTDPMLGTVTCPATTLTPAEAMACTAPAYVITESDVADGGVDNTATVVGTPPSGPDVTDRDITSTPVVPVVPTTTNLVVSKDVDAARPRVGETVSYTITVRNQGEADAENVVVTDHLPSGVTFVSAQEPCTRAGSTVTCELGTLEAGASRSLTVRVKVDPLPQVNTAHQHWIDVQKTEVHVDLEPGQQRSAAVSCQPGYAVTDGSGRVDHVDQGTGTFADVTMTENRASGRDGWQATFVNRAHGRVQAKVFAVCLAEKSEAVDGHTHGPVLGEPVTETRDLAQGRTEVTLSCSPGGIPVQPGTVLDGVATVLTTYPAGKGAWTWVVETGEATSGTFSMRCLAPLVSAGNGHQHALRLDEVRRAGTVPAGRSAEFTLTCADDAKGIVAGYDMDPGLVNQGNDPRPIVRVFKFYNPTADPLEVDLFLLCLGNRTGGTADVGGTVVNTASVTTSTDETSVGDNTDDARFTVDTSAPVTIPVATASVTKRTVNAAIRCGKAGDTCRGAAVLRTTATVRVDGKRIRKGTVLARGHFKVRPGDRAKLRLKITKAGKRALRQGKVRRAKLVVDGKTRVVRLRY